MPIVAGSASLGRPRIVVGVLINVVRWSRQAGASGFGCAGTLALSLGGVLWNDVYMSQHQQDHAVHASGQRGIPTTRQVLEAGRRRRDAEENLEEHQRQARHESVTDSADGGSGGTSAARE